MWLAVFPDFFIHNELVKFSGKIKKEGVVIWDVKIT
jgi:hypothetical protein